MIDHAVNADVGSARRYPSWLGACALIAATILAYLPAIHAEYIWDDDSYVTENPHIRDADGLQRIWIPRETPQYYPLVFSSFWIEYHLWELDPMGYHITNVLFHAANAVLLWIVMIRLRVPGAWLIAAVFALHPVMVESVAWISERKNVMSMFFYLAAALAYLRFDQIRFGEADDPRERREPWGWYGGAIVLFIGALLSKTVTCSLPAALILALLWKDSDRSTAALLAPQRLLPLAPMFLIGIVLALLTIIMEREHVGAQGVEFDLTFLERCLVASKALLFYPWTLLWPHPLMFVYPRWEIDGAQVTQYWSLIVCAAIGVACVLAYRRGYRGPFVALAFYAGTVFPAIGFFNVYPHIFSFVADHFVYHASIGIIAFVIGGTAWLSRRRFGRTAPIRYVAFIILPMLFVLTWNHAAVFHDAETLYRDTIAKNPKAWMPMNNLSSILLRRAEEERREGDESRMHEAAAEAADVARQTLNVRPDHHTAHANLSEALRLLDDLDGALEHARRAADLLPHYPHYHWQVGRLHHLRGDYDDAIRAYADAVERAPRHRSYRRDLIGLLVQEARFDEAAEHLTALLDLDSHDVYALSTLAELRQYAGREREALQLYRRAVEAAASPEDQIRLVTRLIRLRTFANDSSVRDLDQARALAERLVDATGGNDPGSLAVLASVHAERGDYDAAIRLTEQATVIAEQAGLESLLDQLRDQLAAYQAAQ